VERRSVLFRTLFRQVSLTLATYLLLAFGYRQHPRKISALTSIRSVMTTPPSDPLDRHTQVRTEGSADALPFAPAMSLTLDATRMPRSSTLVDRRILRITAVAILLGVAEAFIAALLKSLIGLVTNLAF
jgi:hypothetical protein